MRLKAFSPRYPILVIVSAETLAYVSLHEQLLPLKTTQHVDDAVRAQASEIMARAFDRLQRETCAHT